jgi:putative DNA primase/helicase
MPLAPPRKNNSECGDNFILQHPAAVREKNSTAEKSYSDGSPHTENKLPLHPKDLADLRASGLTDATILQAGLFSVTDPDGQKIATLLNRLPTRPPKEVPEFCKGGGLVIPYFNLDGTRDSFARVKPHFPRKKDGKPIKYEQPAGDDVRAYFAPAALPKIRDGSSSIHILEGEKKCLAVAQLGYAAIGLGGVWCGVKDGKLIADLAAITWKGLDVYIMFDYDPKPEVRRHVAQAAARLASAQRAAGAREVYLVELPPGAGGTKNGVDDFLVARGAAGPQEYADLVEAAKPVPAETYEAHDDPHRLARLYLDRHHHDGMCSLVYWRDEFHRWDGTAYRRLGEAEIRAEIVKRVKEEFDRLNRSAVRKWQERGKRNQKGRETLPPVAGAVTRALVSDVYQAMASIVLLPGTVSQPCWLGEPGPHPAAEFLACRNGLLHLPTTTLLPPTPRFFSANGLEYDYDPDAPAPETWLRFLEDVLPGDLEAQRALRMWFGYHLLPDTSQQKIMMLVGPTRAGKGVVMQALEDVVGGHNFCNPTLGSLGNQFGMWHLIDKTAAVVTDARITAHTNLSMLAERLLSISGEDGVDVDRKFLPPLPGVKLKVRFTILTNELPMIADTSGAVVGRFLFLKFTESFLGREDTGLKAKIRHERTAVLNWAVRGWKQLRAAKRFRQPESGDVLRRMMEDLASPMKSFLEDRCDLGPESKILCDDLYKAWETWCAGVNRDPGDVLRFGRDLAAAASGVERVQKRFGGVRRYHYVGVALKPEPTAVDAFKAAATPL